MNSPPTPPPPVTADRRPRAPYTQIGLTDSLCPECMQVIRAKIIVRGKRVYFLKRCPTHGEREDFVCSDVAWWDRQEGNTPAVLPVHRSTAVQRGCPYDCGLCPDHEQHTCIGLVELTSRCNLSCPMCFANSGPHGTHLTLAEIERALDRLVECEGHAEVCQLSGGEPTLHPEFYEVLRAALVRPIDYIMINTNGIRLANDRELVERIAEHRQRVEIYLQWDGDDTATVESLRGEDLIATKRRALDRLAEAGLHVTLVATLQSPLPADFYERLWHEALSRPNVTGISLQPATYSGRHYLPEQLESRVTFPEVIAGLVQASRGQVTTEDFTPLPCAHPNCHQIMLAARSGDRVVPIGRYNEVKQNLDLLAGGISFTRERSKKLVEAFLARASACGPSCACHDSDVVPVTFGAPSVGKLTSEKQTLLADFLERVLTGQAGAQDLLRITITSFLDAYNFDVRQLMKCCTHHVLPSGHIIPFCAYNTLYRPGHLPLPEIASK